MFIDLGYEAGEKMKSNRLETLIEDHSRLIRENRILRVEVDRLNQIITETAKKLKKALKEK